jgi:hypothetical protein
VRTKSLSDKTAGKKSVYPFGQRKVGNAIVMKYEDILEQQKKQISQFNKRKLRSKVNAVKSNIVLLWKFKRALISSHSACGGLHINLRLRGRATTVLNGNLVRTDFVNW